MHNYLLSRNCGKLNAKLIISLSVHKIFPDKNSSVQNHVGVCAIFLWNRNRTRIQIHKISARLFCRNMSVPAKKNVAFAKWRRIFVIKNVAVACVNKAASCSKNSILCANRKVKHHLVHLGIAVTLNTKNPLSKSIQHFNNFLWLVLKRQVIARPVVKQVSQKQKPVRPLFPKALRHLCTKGSRAVNVARNHQFHKAILPLPALSCKYSKYLIMQGKAFPLASARRRSSAHPLRLGALPLKPRLNGSAISI